MTSYSRLTSDLGRVDSLTEILGDATAIVRAVEDERGTTVLTTYEAAHESDLMAAHAKTDSTLDAFATVWEDNRDAVSPDVQRVVSQVMNRSGVLTQLRDQGFGESNYRAYSTFLGGWTSVVDSIQAEIQDIVAAPNTRPFAAVVDAGVVLADQRGLVVAQLGGGQIDPGRQLELELIEQDAIARLVLAERLAGNGGANEIRTLVASPINAEISALLNDIARGEAEMAPGQWFELSSRRIAALRTAGDAMLDGVSAETVQKVTTATRGQALWALGLSLMLLMAAVVTVGSYIAARDRSRALEEHSAFLDGVSEWFVPDRIGPFAGIEVAAKYVPAATYATAGGDWYDAFPVEIDGVEHIAFSIGDVVGHGSQAGAQMAFLRGLLRGLTLAAPASPAAQIEALNRAARSEGIMATVFHGVLDPSSRQIVYVRAGHVPGLIFDGNGHLEHLGDGGGPLIGAFTAEYEDSKAQCPAGGVVALFTDGCVEGRASSLEAGLQGLHDVTSAAMDDLDAAATAVIEHRPEESDDAAVLLLRLRADVGFG